jgi:modulator of FtsH protease
MNTTLVVTEAWTPFFGTAAGAAAALGGLIIVAMSVNIEVIINSPSMPARAGSTIASLVLAVVVALAALIPEQPLFWFGIEVLAFSVVAAVMHIVEARQIIGLHRNGLEALLKVLVGLGPVLAFVVGGLLLVLGEQAGLVWVAIGTVLVFIGSVVNAWVLLVEIRR